MNRSFHNRDAKSHNVWFKILWHNWINNNYDLWYILITVYFLSIYVFLIYKRQKLMSEGNDFIFLTRKTCFKALVWKLGCQCAGWESIVWARYRLLSQYWASPTSIYFVLVGNGLPICVDSSCLSPGTVTGRNAKALNQQSFVGYTRTHLCSVTVDFNANLNAHVQKTFLLNKLVIHVVVPRLEVVIESLNIKLPEKAEVMMYLFLVSVYCPLNVWYKHRNML